MGNVCRAFLINLTPQVTFSIKFDGKNFLSNAGSSIGYDDDVPKIGNWLVVYCHWWPDGSITLRLSARSHGVDVGKSCTFGAYGRNRHCFQLNRGEILVNSVAYKTVNFEGDFRVRVLDSSPFVIDFQSIFSPKLVKFANASGSIVVIGPAFDTEVTLEKYLQLLKVKPRMTRAVPIPIVALVISIISMLVAVVNTILGALSRFVPVEAVTLVWVESISRFVVYKDNGSFWNQKLLRTVSVDQAFLLLRGPESLSQFVKEYGVHVYSPFYTSDLWEDMAKDSVFGSTYSTSSSF
uniref:P2c protein n=1 Tax=Pea early browning virus TaxID=12294 RepID=A0A8F8MZH0_PEBV|nr:P2c protein [Pea early-browning virus]